MTKKLVVHPIGVESIRISPPHLVRRPVMTQVWDNLTYVHWKYDRKVVQALLPPGYLVDTFDGDAWVGLIPFEMRNIEFPVSQRLRIKTGRFGNFPETNVRTYIVDPRGRRGVWFFSLDINRIAPTIIARVGYRLPYCYAEMTVDTSAAGDQRVIRYASRRRWPGSKSDAPKSLLIIKTGNKLPVDEGSLDAFVSARWALGSRLAGRNLWAEVNHQPWDLFDAELVEYNETLLRAAGLPNPVGEPTVRWSPGVEVRIAWPRITTFLPAPSGEHR
jgi:uncharacterized protein